MDSPVTKDQLVSGQYLIVLFGNNGDSDYPFSAQRNITLNCGIPVTETITPTITWNETLTPVQSKKHSAELHYLTSLTKYSNNGNLNCVYHINI